MAILILPGSDERIGGMTTIAEFLTARGVFYDRWEAGEVLPSEAGQDDVLAAYAHVLEPYMSSNGYQTADVICISPEMEGLEAIRQKFNKEHTHSEDEVRFFVEGRGYFWFNLEDGTQHSVFCVCCESGDIVSVPAGIKHWFTFNADEKVKAIRIFTDKSGWVPHYTDSGVDVRYAD